VLRACYIGGMKTLNLRDANQQFSKLVREIERRARACSFCVTGTRHRMMPAEDRSERRGSSAERQKAIDDLLNSARNNPGRSDPNIPPLKRDEMHER